MALDISLISSTAVSIAVISLLDVLVRDTVCCASSSAVFIKVCAKSVPCWILLTMALTSCVDLLVRDAKLRTSSATTANPRPCSPALAASIAAFKASKFVCSAMALMTSITDPILSLSCLSCLICSLVCSMLFANASKLV